MLYITLKNMACHSFSKSDVSQLLEAHVSQGSTSYPNTSWSTVIGWPIQNGSQALVIGVLTLSKFQKVQLRNDSRMQAQTQHTSEHIGIIQEIPQMRT